MPKREVGKWLEVAEKAALKAGKFLSKNSVSGKRVGRESRRDIKIEADFQSERIIIDYLKRQSGFSILSEESGLITGADRDLMWVVDPLDGSLNYRRGIPLSCVSIGLWQKEKPWLGVVYDFNRSELFSGIAGKRAWLNKRSLKVSQVAQKDKAILCTGFPVNTDFTSDGIKRFVEEVRSYKKVRWLGSAALSIAYVASGRTDAYQEKDIMLWDVAGAIPVLLGAGGKLKIEKVAQPYCYEVFASNGISEDSSREGKG